MKSSRGSAPCDSLETFPNETPYLKALPGDPVLPPKQGTRPRGGLAWRGSGSQPLDRRALPVEALTAVREAEASGDEQSRALDLQEKTKTLCSDTPKVAAVYKDQGEHFESRWSCHDFSYYSEYSLFSNKWEFEQMGISCSTSRFWTKFGEILAPRAVF